MSAKNYLIIKQTPKKYFVQDKNWDAEGYLAIASVKTLKEACLIAQEYMDENEVEGGCWFSLKKKIC